MDIAHEYEPRMPTSGAHARVHGQMRCGVLVADIHPTNHRAVGGVDNPTLEASVRHDCAAHEASRNADAKTAPTPAVTAAPVAVAPGRRGSGRKRDRAKGCGCGENKSHLAEHEVSPCSVGCVFHHPVNWSLMPATWFMRFSEANSVINHSASAGRYPVSVWSILRHQPDIR